MRNITSMHCAGVLNASENNLFLWLRRNCKNLADVSAILLSVKFYKAHTNEGRQELLEVR